MKISKKMHEEQSLQAKQAHIEQMNQNEFIKEQSRRRDIFEKNKQIREYNKNVSSAQMLKSEIPEDW